MAEERPLHDANEAPPLSPLMSEQITSLLVLTHGGTYVIMRVPLHRVPIKVK